MSWDIGDLQRQGITYFTAAAWSVTIILSLMWASGLPYAKDALLMSALVNAFPSLAVYSRRFNQQTRDMLGLVAAIQPALLVYSVQTSGFQQDMHLYFFVALAALISLCDVRPIIIAGAAIILHHVLLSSVVPIWVFTPGSNVSTLVVHAVATLLIVGILCVATRSIRKTIDEVGTAHAAAERNANLLTEQSRDLQQALHRVELERSRGEKIEAEKEQQRSAELERFSREFEVTIASIIQTVSKTAAALGETTQKLDVIANETGDEAERFRDSARTAAKSADTVARGISELTDSISKIAVNVSQQDELTTLATQRTQSGGKTVSSLTEHSETIGEATRAIARIAQRTNLLSLNAAIEAATAGPAGRGFTVVAQEVKGLAMQAGEAATQIEEFLSGVHSGTLEARDSFKTIDEAIAELDQAAKAIRWDVEDQRKSAGTIENYARNAANELDAMVGSSQALAVSADSARQVSGELNGSANTLLESIRQLEGSTAGFIERLRAA